jgi:hypothetical protein
MSAKTAIFTEAYSLLRNMVTKASALPGASAVIKVGKFAIPTIATEIALREFLNIIEPMFQNSALTEEQLSEVYSMVAEALGKDRMDQLLSAYSSSSAIAAWTVLVARSTVNDQDEGIDVDLQQHTPTDLPPMNAQKNNKTFGQMVFARIRKRGGKWALTRLLGERNVPAMPQNGRSVLLLNVAVAVAAALCFLMDNNPDDVDDLLKEQNSQVDATPSKQTIVSIADLMSPVRRNPPQEKVREAIDAVTGSKVLMFGEIVTHEQAMKILFAALASAISDVSILPGAEDRATALANKGVLIYTIQDTIAAGLTGSLNAKIDSFNAIMSEDRKAFDHFYKNFRRI